MSASVPLPRLGEAAALATSVCWAVSACAFTAASRRLPAQRVNQMRLLLACLLLQTTLVVRALSGANDDGPTFRQGAFLLASGFVGLMLGDIALFRAFELLDTRRVVLVTSSAPVFVVLLGAPLLGESLGWSALVGIAVTLGGIAWVLAERTVGAKGGTDPAGDAAESARLREGVTMAVLAAIGQAVGVILAKAGLGRAAPDTVLGALAADSGRVVPVSELTGTAVRMIGGAATLFAFAAATGALRGFAGSWRAGRGTAFTVLGTVFGPFVGVWLSLVAVAHTKAGIAQTLIALQPVVVLPFSRWLFGERITLRAVLGAFVAVIGVAILTLH